MKREDKKLIVAVNDSHLQRPQKSHFRRRRPLVLLEGPPPWVSHDGGSDLQLIVSDVVQGLPVAPTYAPD